MSLITLYYYHFLFSIVLGDVRNCDLKSSPILLLIKWPKYDKHECVRLKYVDKNK